MSSILLTNFNRTALYRLLIRAGEDVASGRCPGWACDYAVCEPDWMSFRCCELSENGEPLCLRDADLRPEHGPVTPDGHRRQDYFTPIVDWYAVGWHSIAVHYGFALYERWNRNAWRAERYQRRKAWKRRAPAIRANAVHWPANIA